MQFPVAQEAYAGHQMQEYLAPPSEIKPEQRFVERSFLFLDLVGSVEMMETQGPDYTVRELIAFRQLCRELAVDRGVRVSKWLGDGVFIVGVNPEPLHCAAAEFLWRAKLKGMKVAGGLASGKAIIFEGDDYLSAAANLASRLADAAPCSTVYAHKSDVLILDWVRHHRLEESLKLKGFESPIPVDVITGVSEDIYHNVDPTKMSVLYSS